MTCPRHWGKDEIQFSRLLAEIRAVGLTEWQYLDLGRLMGIERADINKILDRAETQWVKIKMAMKVSP